MIKIKDNCTSGDLNKDPIMWFLISTFINIITNKSKMQEKTVIPNTNIFLFKDLLATSSGSLLIRSNIDKINTKINKYCDPYKIP